MCVLARVQGLAKCTAMWASYKTSSESETSGNIVMVLVANLPLVLHHRRLELYCILRSCIVLRSGLVPRVLYNFLKHVCNVRVRVKEVKNANVHVIMKNCKKDYVKLLCVTKKIVKSCMKSLFRQLGLRTLSPIIV